MSSYSGTADRPDRAKAIAAVVAVHAALAAIILAGLNGGNGRQAVERAEDDSTSPSRRRLPRRRRRSRAPKPQQMKKPEGAPAKKAEPTPVVAPPPTAPPLAGSRGQDRRHRAAPRLGRRHRRERYRRRRSGQRTGWRREPIIRASPRPGWFANSDAATIARSAAGRMPAGRAMVSLRVETERRAEQLPDRAVERRFYRRSRPVPADRGAAALPSRARRPGPADPLPAAIRGRPGAL